jgi:ribosomal-protein-alanine N-acetyltransferase
VKTQHLELIPHIPSHLLALGESAEKYELASGRRIAQDVRDFLLLASADFLASLQTAVEPDPWRFGFAILHRADEVMIGLCGFAGPPDGNGVVEFGYSIAPEYQGKGYATEAAMALSEFATKDSRVRTICVPHPITAECLYPRARKVRIYPNQGIHRSGRQPCLALGTVTGSALTSLAS